MRNRTIVSATVGAMFAALAFSTPASAVVTITSSVCASCENVHLVPGGNLADNLAQGTTQGGVIAGVTFTGLEPIATGEGNGLPWVAAIDGGLTYLDVALNPGFTFTLAGFNLNDLSGNDSWSVRVSAFDGATLKASQVFTESHNTMFKIAATGSDVLTHFQIQLLTGPTGGAVPLAGALQLDGVGQIKIDGVAGVPEPATWALMIFGFGGAGAMLRRRRTALA